MGRALSAWNEIEVEFTKLFMAYCEGQGGYRTVAVRAFGSIHAFEARVEMLKSASQAFFMIERARAEKIQTVLLNYVEKIETQCSPGWLENLEKAMDALYSEAKRFASRRNEIAHGIVSPKFGSFPMGGLQGFVLHPAPMDKKSNIYSTPTFAYSSVELQYYELEFKKLSAGALRLNLRLHVLRRELHQLELEHRPENHS